MQVDHCADALADVHEVEALVDLVEAHLVGHEGVDGNDTVEVYRKRTFSNLTCKPSPHFQILERPQRCTVELGTSCCRA